MKFKSIGINLLQLHLTFKRILRNIKLQAALAISSCQTGLH
jgi:hypothetical protein